jgi:3-dehydroquinate synthase
MATTVRVELGERSYEIRIGAGALDWGWAGLPRECRALLVTDHRVEALYAERCEAALRALGWQVTREVVPAGEASKCMAMVERLCARAVEGGLAGYAAASYLRGVRFVQVPTTLLAMVDSSVGGKTGVNLPQGKNLVGAFHQPMRVVADLACLDTLSEREYAAGMAEVVKYGVIRDAGLFAQLEADAAGLRGVPVAPLEGIVARCCRLKAEVVAEDEREGGVRAVLNFGHTLGHALEALGEYQACLHGEAVAMGMEYAAALSERVCGFPAAERERLVRLLRALGLPALAAGPAHSWSDIRRVMTRDKKASGGLPRFVLAERLGRVRFGCEVDEDALRGAYEWCLAQAG